MKNYLISFSILYILVFILFGCSEEAETPANILKTEPTDGGEMFIQEEMVILFDKNVNSVKINGNAAEVNGDRASWKLENINAGKQSFLIEWTDVDGISGSHEINLTVMNLDGTICFSGKIDLYTIRNSFPYLITC
ncbi:hypothetical protein GF312_02700 [Candidatus Poribacteria bacterium]|nr:hypothetical protein [Candidatus Poribacteria bacterium]